MMIDDDPSAHFFHKIMMKDAGLPTQTVSEYTDPDQAITDLEQLWRSRDILNWPDVIIIDLNMPLMTGWEFVEKLEALNIDENIPQIYMVSNSDDPRDLKKSEENPWITGFKEKFLTKDFFVDLAVPH